MLKQKSSAPAMNSPSSAFNPQMHTFAVLVCLLLILHSINPVHSQCKSPPILFNFGDSNSDTGGLVAGLGIPIYMPNGRAFFGKSTGRLSDGRLIVDFLCQSVNTSLLDPYLDSLGTTFSNGANFAVAGSTTLPQFVAFALHIQVLQFLRFKDRSPELGHLTRFSDALYMIDIGQNDLADSFAKNLSYARVVKKIPSILAEIKGAIKEIYDHEGRKFWIHNTGPLGCLPQKLALAKTRIPKDDLDPSGCILTYNNAAKLLNQGLRILCQELRSEMKDATIVYVDIYAIKYDLIANSGNYGFSSPLTACCGSGEPPYNYDPRVTCGHPGYKVCDPKSRLVSWDGVHYTEAANEFVASKILLAKYTTPPVSFNFFCN